MNNFLNLTPEDLVPIGKIVKAHGLLGEIKAFLYNNHSESLKPKIKIWLSNDNKFINYEIEYIKNNKFIKFLNINDRNNAEQLNGKKIYLSRNAFPVLKNSQYYLNDIIGFNIKDENDCLYGTVLDVIQLPTNNSILFNYNDKEVIIPIIDDFVALFDVENDVVIIKNFKEFFIK